MRLNSGRESAASELMVRRRRLSLEVMATGCREPGRAHTEPPRVRGWSCLPLDSGDKPQRRALGVALVGRRHAELRGQLLGRQRPRQVVALGEVAAEARELLPDLAVLDALRDDLQAEVVGQ